MTNKQTGKWKTGESGNPRGRPKGSRNRATLLAVAAMEGELENVVRVVIDAAKAGDMVAARLVVDKLIPATRERALSIDLPVMKAAGDYPLAQSKVLEAVASGQILPGEGEVLSGLIEQHRRAFETAELGERLTVLEERLKARA